MNLRKTACFLLLLASALQLGAQNHNSVPLGHAAYDIIAMGVMRGIILPPPSAKPWSENTVTVKLSEMIHDPLQLLTSREVEIAAEVLASFERRQGFEPHSGRYYSKGETASFETGYGWESVFSVETAVPSIASVNLARVYAGGGIAGAVSWQVSAQGGLLYIERDTLQTSPLVYTVPAAFPYTASRQWDGGVLALRGPAGIAGWPDEPSLAFNVSGEANAVFYEGRIQLRLGRIRREWGSGADRASLLLNAQAKPFAAIEGTFSPFPWMDFSLLGGALEHCPETAGGGEGPFSGFFALSLLEFNSWKYLRLGVGGSAVFRGNPNAAMYSSLELRLPGMLSLWGSLFVNGMDFSQENFFSLNKNRFAYQAGIKTLLHWLPFAVFTLSYTKIEPYCYADSLQNAGRGSTSAFMNAGGPLGSSMPPNSDELLLRLESMLIPEISAYIQFQAMRRGADYGYGAVAGSSLYDNIHQANQFKYFLMDGVYRWNNVVKIGGSLRLAPGGAPLAFFAEAGFVSTSFTVNGDAGSGNEAEYESLNNNVYRARDGFIFSAGFKVF